MKQKRKETWKENSSNEWKKTKKETYAIVALRARCQPSRDRCVRQPGQKEDATLIYLDKRILEKGKNTNKKNTIYNNWVRVAFSFSLSQGP